MKKIIDNIEIAMFCICLFVIYIKEFIVKGFGINSKSLQVLMPLVISSLLIYSNENYIYLLIPYVIVLVLIYLQVKNNKTKTTLLIYGPIILATIIISKNLFMYVPVNNYYYPEQYIYEYEVKEDLLNMFGVKAKLPEQTIRNIKSIHAEIISNISCNNRFDGCYVDEKTFNKVYPLYNLLHKEVTDLHDYIYSLKEDLLRSTYSHGFENYLVLQNWDKKSNHNSFLIDDYHENKFRNHYLLLLLILAISCLYVLVIYRRYKYRKEKIETLIASEEV